MLPARMGVMVGSDKGIDIIFGVNLAGEKKIEGWVHSIFILSFDGPNNQNILSM